MSKTKYVSIPGLTDLGGHIEAAIDDDGPVTVFIKKGSDVLSLPFDREEFMEWIQVVGTTLRN